MPRPVLDVAQIFRQHGPDYQKNQRLSPGQYKAMRDIERCRTARLGGHVDVCSQGCGYLAISYNSCRNRHCPKCQSLQQARWLAERLERLLPTHYFHLVVTLPHELNTLALSNPELVFNLLFTSVSQALLQFARDYERLQAQVGFTAVLHTWDQVLNLHPHLHLVVTGGGLSADGQRWVVPPVTASCSRSGRSPRSSGASFWRPFIRLTTKANCKVWQIRCSSDASPGNSPEKSGLC